MTDELKTVIAKAFHRNILMERHGLRGLAVVSDDARQAIDEAVEQGWQDELPDVEAALQAIKDAGYVIVRREDVPDED